MLLFALVVWVGVCTGNISFENGPLFNLFEARFERLWTTHRRSASNEPLLCNQQLMVFSADLADEISAGAAPPAVDVWQSKLNRLEAAAAYEHDVAALVVGVAFQTPEAFWAAVIASSEHAAALSGVEYAEFGVGHEPLNGVWVLTLAKARAGAAKSAASACPPLAAQKLFVPLGVESLRQVSIGTPTDILATDAGGAVVRRYVGCFREIGSALTCGNSHCCPTWSLGMAPQAGATWVSTSLDSTCYAASASASRAPELFKRRPLASGTAAMSWEKVAGSFARVSVGRAGVVYGISAAKNLYKLDFETSKWTLMPGQFQHVAVGADGTVWAIDHANARVMRRRDGQWIHVKGHLDHIAVGDAGSVWGIGAADKRLYAYAGDAIGWRRFSGGDSEVDAMGQQTPRYVSVGANTYELWLVDTAGTVFRLARPDLAAALLAGTAGEPMEATDDDSLHLSAVAGLTAALPDDDMAPFTTSTPISETISPIGGGTKTPELAKLSISKNPAPTTTTIRAAAQGTAAAATAAAATTASLAQLSVAWAVVAHQQL
jgi:hypothetical protein